MNRVRFTKVATCVFLFLVVPFELPQETEPTTPSEVASQFFKAIISSEIDEALRLSKAPTGIPDVGLREEYQMMSERAQGRLAPEITAHLQLGTTAVVIIRDSAPGAPRIDLDAVYMILHDGSWRVLFEGSEFNELDFGFSDRTIQHFRLLEKWTREQKTELKDLLKKLDEEYASD